MTEASQNEPESVHSDSQSQPSSAVWKFTLGSEGEREGNQG